MKRLPRLDPYRAAGLLSLVNISFAAWHLYLGLTSPSRWFMALGCYYLFLLGARLTVLGVSRKSNTEVMPKAVGMLLILTALPLIALVIISSVKPVDEVGTVYHEIVMITIALYAFTKITLAVINLIQAKKKNSASERSLRSISLADALVSIASLQRSMLLSFGSMAEADIRLFNTLTGTGVCVSVLLIGVILYAYRKLESRTESVAKH